MFDVVEFLKPITTLWTLICNIHDTVRFSSYSNINEK